MPKPSRICYVIMPFAEQYNAMYRDAIQPAVVAAARQTSIPLVCRRGDEFAGPGSIAREIIDSIYHSQVIVAVLSGNNPNVFYELGIAHSAGNKTVMVTQDVNSVPFDVQSYRVIEYDESDRGRELLRNELTTAIIKVCDGVELPSNPVYDFAPICHSNLVLPAAEVLEIEGSVQDEIWIIEPNSETDLKLFAEVVTNNVLHRGITYKYILPDTRDARRSSRRFLEKHGLADPAINNLEVRYVDEHQVESEVIVYDPYSIHEKVVIMSPIEEKLPYFFLISGSKSKKIRERFEDLWESVST